MNDDDVHEAYLALSQALGNPVLDNREGEPPEITLVREATRRLMKEQLVPWPRVRTLATLPGTKLTPTVVLGRTLEKAQHGKLKDVYIGLHWADRDEFDYDYSLMPIRDLSMHRLVLERRLQNVAFGGSDSNETLNPAS